MLLIALEHLHGQDRPAPPSGDVFNDGALYGMANGVIVLLADDDDVGPLCTAQQIIPADHRAVGGGAARSGSLEQAQLGRAVGARITGSNDDRAGRWMVRFEVLSRLRRAACDDRASCCNGGCPKRREASGRTHCVRSGARSASLPPAFLACLAVLAAGRLVCLDDLLKDSC